jgi:hypothetical protein
MANPTTNYGWPMPTATDLVTDLPADFAAFGQPVDTSLKALNPETTLGDMSYRSATANTKTRLAIGSTGNVLTVAGGVPTWAASSTQTFAIFNDTKSSGTNGGTFTNGAWRTRDLQTSQFNNITSCSLASNQITLPAGTFRITGFAGAYYVDRHQTRIYNITGSAVLLSGMSAYASSPGDAANGSFFDGIITLAGSTVIELQHRGQTTRATDGFGIAVSWGDNIYSSITITKVG